MNIMTWDWIAGFFEGEGNISWYQGVRGTKQGTSGRIVIGQKDKRPLVAIKSFLEEKGFKHCLLYVRPSRPPKNRLWILAINQRDEVIKFLDHIMPMLFEKQEKALEISTRLLSLIWAREGTLAEALKLRKEKKTWREISRLMHISYQTLANYARSKGIELKIEPFDGLTWRQDRIKRGLCASCGKMRGDKGTKRMCRSCQDKSNRRTKEWKRKQRKELKM